MSVGKCNACEKIIDLDYDIEGAWDSIGRYFCFSCIEKYGMKIEEYTDNIINLGEFR